MKTNIYEAEDTWFLVLSLWLLDICTTGKITEPLWLVFQFGEVG